MDSDQIQPANSFSLRPLRSLRLNPLTVVELSHSKWIADCRNPCLIRVPSVAKESFPLFGCGSAAPCSLRLKTLLRQPRMAGGTVRTRVTAGQSKSVFNPYYKRSKSSHAAKISLRPRRPLRLILLLSSNCPTAMDRRLSKSVFNPCSIRG
jgi:hypothetical protein